MPTTVPVCAAKSLTLAVGTGAPSYPAGGISDLTLILTNSGPVSCRIDLGSRVQQALVYHGRDRLWSSSDCYPGSDSDVVTMQPRQAHRMVIRWSGDTSSPGCAGKRVPVPAGNYTVIGMVGSIRAQGALILHS